MFWIQQRNESGVCFHRTSTSWLSWGRHVCTAPCRAVFGNRCDLRFLLEHTKEKTEFSPCEGSSFSKRDSCAEVSTRFLLVSNKTKRMWKLWPALAPPCLSWPSATPKSFIVNANDLFFFLHGLLKAL